MKRFESSNTKKLKQTIKKEKDMKAKKEKALKQPKTIKVWTIVQLAIVFVALALAVGLGYIFGQVQANDYHNQVVREASQLVEQLKSSRQTK